MDRLKKQIDFLIEIDKLKGILRQSLVLEGTRRENDTEHSWHMATSAFILREYYKKDVDMERVIKMVLIHDVVEILAGDTPAYSDYSAEEKYQKEVASAKQTFGILPDDQREEYIALWNEFEDMETDESKFANACDRFQGFIQNVTSDAHTWRKFSPKKSRILKRMRPIIEYMPEVYNGYIKDYLQKYIDLGVVEDDFPIKAVVTDMDGTFLATDKSISDENREVVAKVIAKGLEFVVASGRDSVSIKELVKDISGIKYIISLNGARVYKNDEIIYEASIDEDVSYDILSKASEINLEYSATGEKNIYYSQLDLEYKNIINNPNSGLNFICDKEKKNILRDKYQKLVFYNDKEKFKVLRDYVNEKYSDKVNIFDSGDRIMDIVSKETNKGKGLKIVAEDMGIALDEIIAFGDNENDLSMLEEVIYSVAMGNSLDIVKEKVRYVGKTNNESGVAKFLNLFLKLD